MSSPQFLLSLDLSVDPNYGFVRALRKISSCNPRRLTSDSISMFIHADFVGDAETILKCIRGLEGVGSIEIKLCLLLPTDEKVLRNLLKKLGFSLIPRALASRVVAYQRVEGGPFLVLERTSRPGLYLAKVARSYNPPLPPPHSFTSISGRINDVIERCSNIVELLKNLFYSFNKEGIKSVCIST